MFSGRSFGNSGTEPQPAGGSRDGDSRPSNDESPRGSFKKPFGRGRGAVKKDSDQPQTKTQTPHNRKAMAAKKNNFGAPGFY